MTHDKTIAEAAARAMTTEALGVALELYAEGDTSGSIWPEVLTAELDRRREPGRVAAAVVVDTKDGYTFWRGSDGVLFTAGTAEQFATHRNAEMKPEHRSYRVYALVPAGGPQG